MPHSDDRKGTSPWATGRGRRDARSSAQRRPTTKRAGKDCLGTCEPQVSGDLEHDSTIKGNVPKS